jgi:hypothetical protein
MRDVVLVAEQELQSVVARGERHFCFGLPRAEMQMVEIVRDRLIERGHRRVDQQMVVAGIRAIGAGGRNSHIPQPEMDDAFRRNGCAIPWVDEVNGSTSW